MSTNLPQKAFSGSMHQYAASLVMFIFSALTSIYIIRELTVEEFGIYGFIGSLIAMASVITALGLAPTIQRYLPEYREKGNNYIQKRIVSISMLIRLLAALIFVSILLIANNWIINIFNLPLSFQKFFPLVALIILLVLESNLLGNAALVALFENKYWNLSRTLYTCLKFILFYISLSNGYGILGLIWCWLIVEVVLFMLFLIKAYKVIFSLPLKKEDIQPLPIKRFFNFGKYLILQQSTWFFRDTATDIFLISYFIGTYAVGLYSFAIGIPLMLMGFSPGSRLRAIFTPLFVHSYTKTNDKQQLSYFFELVNKIIFFSMIPIFIILMILADKVILYVFNPEYLTVTNLFVLSLGFVMIQQFAYAYTSIVYTLEKTKIVFVGSLFAFYNLIMDIILIPPLGILGAILATGSAGMMLPIYYHFAMRRDGEIELKHPWKSFMIFSVNTVITAVIVFLLRGFINNILSLFCVLAIAVILYLGLSYLNKGFDDKDRKIFNDAIGKDIFRF
jgi:O-antigen/teichoic acid export membrane protein